MTLLISDPLDRLLRDDLNRLTDRLARSGGPGGGAETLARLEGAERRLTELRQALLEGYGQWRAAIDACEDLGALAGLKGDAPAQADRRAA